MATDTPEPQAVHRQRAARLARLVHRMVVQQHLRFIHHAVPQHRVLALRHGGGDATAAHRARADGANVGRGAWPGIPARTGQYLETEVIMKMRRYRRGQRLRFFYVQLQRFIVQQHQLIAFQFQMHRVDPHPGRIVSAAIRVIAAMRVIAPMHFVSLRRFTQPGIGCRRVVVLCLHAKHLQPPTIAIAGRHGRAPRARQQQGQRRQRRHSSM